MLVFAKRKGCVLPGPQRPPTPPPPHCCASCSRACFTPYDFLSRTPSCEHSVCKRAGETTEILAKRQHATAVFANGKGGVCVAAFFLFLKPCKLASKHFYIYIYIHMYIYIIRECE